MPDGKLQFRATIQIRGVNPYVLVSAEQAAGLRSGWRKPMPVRIQVNGKPDVPWRINMMPVGDGDFFLYLAGEVRKASATGVGDRVSLSVAFDDDYKGGPADLVWFEDELAGNDAAGRAWDSLSPSRQKEIVRYLANLKSPEARRRNLERALGVLSGDQARFMARSWNTADGE
jgi:hypothetical protein